MNSRDKGKRGELEWAHWLTDRGFPARRGVQYSGGAGSADVAHDIPGVHFEVKRVEKGSMYTMYAWLAQAERDAGDNLPVVAHRRSRGNWTIIVPAEALFAFLVARGAITPAPADSEDHLSVEPEEW